MATPQMATAQIKKRPPLEYAHLVKPLKISAGPEGLYPEPRIWMYGKDMEGFNAHFTYGFINGPTQCHPMQGALVHPYDECLVFVGTDNNNIKYLGAEISVVLGAEREEHRFNQPTVILIPKGLPHGPVTVKSVEKPIVHYAFGLAPEYKATPVAAGPPTRGMIHSHLIRRMITALDRPQDSSGMGYAQVLGPDGVLRPSERGVGPGNGDQIVWLYGKDLEGMNVNFTWGFYSKTGKWHRGGEAHTHPEEEALVFVGLDANDLNYLGSEQEMGLGPNHERHIFNQPTVVVAPKGFPHLPCITRWADKPYGFFVLCLSGEHASPWVEA